MKINFTESDIQDMLEAVLNGDTSVIFDWDIDGQKVEITVGEDQE